MSLLKYEYVCTECNEQLFIITEELCHKLPEFCPLCGNILPEEEVNSNAE